MDNFLIDKGTYLLKLESIQYLIFSFRLTMCHQKVVSSTGLPAASNSLALSLWLWLAFAAVSIGTVPEWARRGHEGLFSRSADGVSCEGRGAVVLGRNYPLPESSARVFRVKWDAVSWVLRSCALAIAARYFARDCKLSYIVAHLAPTFPLSALQAAWTEHSKTCFSFRSNRGIPATLEGLLQNFGAAIRPTGAVSIHDADWESECLGMRRGDPLPVSCSLTSLIFLDSDRLNPSFLPESRNLILEKFNVLIELLLVFFVLHSNA